MQLIRIILLGVAVFSFTPLASAQYSNDNMYAPFTGIASNVTHSSVTLNGTVSVLSNVYTAAWFEYGINTSFSYSTPRVTYGSGYFHYNYDLSRLRSNTTYYFRAVTQNAYGIQYGNINYFTTGYQSINNSNLVIDTSLSLNAITEPATGVGRTSAQLNSIISSGGDDSAYTYFEWGTTGNFGNNTESVAIGSYPSVKHAGKMTGLAPNTTYYFRAVAQSSSSRVNGSTLSFTTSSLPVSSPASTKTDTIKNTTKPADSPLGSNLAASVFGAGSFLPTNLLGWIILIILALILIILGKKFYSDISAKKSTPKKEEHSLHA